VADLEQSGMPAGWEPAVAFERSFDGLYGLRVLSEDVAGAGVVRGAFDIGPDVLTEHGVLHGGVYAGAAEALASRGTALIVMPDGNAAMGLSNDTSVLASPASGTIELEARALSRGDQAWLWTVDARDGDGRLCAHSRVTVAVRPISG
jgi:uncharacterized protein (TIGR00369 family)